MKIIGRCAEEAITLASVNPEVVFHGRIHHNPDYPDVMVEGVWLVRRNNSYVVAAGVGDKGGLIITSLDHAHRVKITRYTPHANAVIVLQPKPGV